MKAEAVSDWSSAREAILGNQGGPLLRFMRDVFFGRVAPGSDQEIALLAQDLGWVTLDSSSAWRLTPHGGLVADSAREYCNWLDDKRQLPSGMVEEDLRGKAVLDLGCGFGRHVFSASRVASLAVGLEAERAYLQMSSILRAREDAAAAELVCAYGEQIPFADNVFDVLISTRSLHYMDASVVIPEMSRVLRIGGKVFLIVATFEYFVTEFFGGPQHTPGIRERLGVIKQMINSLCVSWTGRRIFLNRGKATTASYVLLTARRLRQIMEKSGLVLQSHSPSKQLFVVERIR